MATNNGANQGSANTTGSGDYVKATSPTLITPNLGTPSAIDLTNATNVPGGGGGGAMIFLDSKTASASSSLEFTTGISTTYSHYVFIADGLYGSVSQRVYLTYSNDGGATYKSAGYNYAGLYVGGSTPAVTAYGAGNDSKFDLSGKSTNTGSVDNPENTIVHAHHLASATVVPMFMWDSSTLGTPGGYCYRSSGSGSRPGWGDYNVNAVKFAPDTGTFTAGVIRMYGIANS